tara:strand:+ start:986 stop:1555 length:570 start_codon:yes stop_codon:yes gene_type:complete
MAKKTVTKTVTKKKTTKSSKKSSPPPQVKSVEPVQAPPLSEAFGELLTQVSVLRSQLTVLTSSVRSLQKRTERELRAAQKASKKRQKSKGNRAPSGFVKPTQISDELANFLGKPKGTEMARTEVTREINTYIRAHKLQDPKNGRRILPDKKLAKLLSVGKKDELTYFNLQKFMSPHFAKAGAAPLANSQ